MNKNQDKYSQLKNEIEDAIIKICTDHNLDLVAYNINLVSRNAETTWRNKTIAEMRNKYHVAALYDAMHDSLNALIKDIDKLNLKD